MNSVPVLHPGETESHHSINGKFPSVILVPVSDHSNRHFILAPGCTNTRITAENWVKSMCFCQIHCNFMCSEDLCKLGKKYRSTQTCKFYTFSRENSKAFDI